MNEVENGICIKEILVYISLELSCFFTNHIIFLGKMAGNVIFCFFTGLRGLMGIVNLLPQLKSISELKSLSCFKGQRVGIDIMCWLV